MLSEAGSIRIYEQKFGGIVLPEGDDISEEARVRAAAIGVYELWFRQQPHYELTGAFLVNDEKPEQQKQFEVAEDIAEAERTLTIRSTADGVSLDSVETIPLDSRDNPLEFTPLEVSQTQRKIRYPSDPLPESLKLKFSGINVFEVETINTVLWANGRDFSPGKLAAFVRRSEDFRLDRLENPQGGLRKIEEHLLTFFHILLEKAPDRTFDFECNYRYPLLDGAANAVIPVFFPVSVKLPTGSEFFSSLLPKLRNWYQNSSPPKGVFDFGVKVYGAGSREAAPVLQFTGLLLPIESIARWSDAG